MAIKVTVGEQKTQNELPFPKLMIANEQGVIDTGIIVLFSEVSVGTVIKSAGKSSKCVGYSSSNFLMYCFDDLNEPITLQNETT